MTITALPGARARIVARRPLRYATALHPSEDVPLHVRAASALVRHGDELFVVQDDTHVVARIDARGDVHAILLPRGDDGGRRFDDTRGNKHLKLDLEAAIVVSLEGRAWLVAFGSGSKAARERAVLIEAVTGRDAPEVRLVSISPFHAALRAHGLLTSELNLEGAVCHDDAVWFAQRGNGLPLEPGVAAENAIFSIPTEDVLALLGGRSTPPRIDDVRSFRLDTLGGARLGVTDLATCGGRLWFAAAAEDSPDATRDGEVAGCAIGVLGGHEGYAVVTDLDGAPSRDKIEGLVVESTTRCLAVIDADDPDRPSEVLTIDLDGFDR